MPWLAPHDGRLVRPAVISDVAIQFRPTIKELFKVPLGQTTGMVGSPPGMAKPEWTVPYHSILCRRQKILAVRIPSGRADGPLDCPVDSTGIKFLG